MFDDFDDDFDSEEYKKEKERVSNLPIMLKAKEIFDLVQSIIVTIEEVKGDKVNEVLNGMKGLLFEDSMVLQVKIAGAEAVGLYEIKMANAAEIRKAGINLISHTFGMEIYGCQFQEYTDLLLEELEEFRLLFLDWISTFDNTHRGIDSWGMFNPPGVNPNKEEDLF